MKKVKIIILLFSIILICFSCIKITQGYSNLPTVYFDGNKKEILFLNANNGDLFNNLKELMPGDKESQDILLKFDNINNEIKVFLKVTNRELNELPNGVTINLYENEKKLEQKEDLINLGTFSKDEESNLRVEVKIDEEAGNELQDLEYNFNWQFFIQENEKDINSENNTENENNENTNNDLSEIPYTYDNSNIYIYIIICIISFIMMVLSIIELRKESNKE